MTKQPAERGRVVTMARAPVKMNRDKNPSIG